MCNKKLVYKNVDSDSSKDPVNSYEKMSQDHEKRVYSSIRFDAASNLWGIDLEGTVYCLE